MTHMRTRIFSILLTCAMLLSLLPATAMASGEADVAMPSYTVGTAEGSDYATISDAVAAIQKNGNNGVITMTSDITEDVIIPVEVTVELNLGTYTLTNVSSHTITNNGTLTVTGAGTVDNVSHGKAALYNSGTATLSGGTFSRSAEASTSSNSGGDGGNSWYVVFNAGNLTIQSGTRVQFAEGNTGKFSSMIVNSDDVENPTITINGGTFVGGLNTVKNEKGTVTINGGSFSNTEQDVFYNYAVLNITGGEFECEHPATYVVYNWRLNPSDIGMVTISGGKFTAPASVPTLVNIDNNDLDFGAMGAPDDFVPADEPGVITVTGGTFSSDVSEFVGPDSVVTEQDGKFVVEALTAANAVASIGNTYYKTLADAVAAAQNNDTVYLLKTTSGPGVKVEGSGRNITIDLGNYIYTVTAPLVGSSGTETNGFQFLKGNTVIIQNGGLHFSKEAKMGIKNYCDLTLNNVQIVADGGLVAIPNCGQLTVNGENTSVTTDGKWAITTGNYQKGDVITTTINAGTISSVACETPLWEFGSATQEESVTTTINGGKIGVLGVYDWRQDYGPEYQDAPLLTNWRMYVTNGEIENLAFDENAKGKVSFTGGTFSVEPDKDYLATGYEAVGDNESGWKVQPKAEGGMAVTDTKTEGDTVSTTLEGVYTGPSTEVANDTSAGGSGNAATGDNDEQGNLTVDLTQTNGGSITTATLEIKNNTAASLDAANSLTLKGNVGTVKLDAQALDAIAKADDDVTIEIKNDNGTYTVTAKAGSTNLLPADSGTNATVTISVPYTLDSSKTDVLVFWVDGTQPEPMKTTYSAGESGNAGTLTWTTPHLSEFMGVSYANTDEVVYFTSSNTTGTAGSLAAALEAVKSSGGTIWLLKDATLNDASYWISKDVAVKSAGVSQTTPVINATVPASGKCFTVYNTGSLVLEDINLKIQKAENATATYGIDVYHGATLTMNNVKLELKDLFNGTISSDDSQGEKTPGVFELNHSTITATNIGGNFSNGGNWKLTNGSKIEISGCTSHGLSCDSLTVDNSTVNVSGTGLLGVTAREIKLENHGQITVDSCGTSLPKESQWSTDGVSYKYPVEIKKNGSVSVDSTSAVELRNNTSGNTIYLVESNLKNSGTINAQVVTKAPDGAYTVTVMDRGTLLEQKTVSSSDSYTLPAAPAAPSGYTFAGWSDGSKTYGAGREVTIDKNTNFTAVWNYNGPTGGGSSSSGDYIVSVDRTTGGKVTVNPGRADKGDTVTITVKPNDGYQLDKLTVTDKSGDAVKLTNKGDGKYTFTMPSGTVDVKATFVKIDAGSVLDNFLDVSDNAWYSKAVEFVVEEGLMSGTSGITFEPNTSMSRAMIWTVLAAYDGYNTAGGNPWYAPGQQWAMLNGVSDGTNPSGDLTREQLAVMLWRAAGSPNAGSLSGYTDASSVSDWAQTAMAWAVQNSILSGVGGSSLAPQMTATRAQVAVMLMQFVNYMDA